MSSKKKYFALGSRPVTLILIGGNIRLFKDIKENEIEELVVEEQGKR